jgi:hypothetical protein
MNGASQPPHLAITSMAESKAADLIARGRSLLGVQGDGDKNAICGAWGGKGNTDVLHMGRIHLEALHLAFENGKLEVKNANGSSAALDPDPPVACASQTSSAATAPPGKTVPNASNERALDTAAAANSSTSSGRPPKPGAAQAGSARKPPIGPAGPPHKSTHSAAASGGPSSPLRQPIPQATQDGQNFNELDELLRDEKWRVKAETLMNLVASHPQLSLSKSSTGASSKPGDKSEAGNVKRRLMVNRDVGIAELDKDNKFTAVNNGAGTDACQPHFENKTPPHTLACAPTILLAPTHRCLVRASDAGHGISPRAFAWKRFVEEMLTLVRPSAGLQELLQTNAKALLGLPLMSLFRLEVPQGSLIETLKSNGAPRRLLGL